jgi:hypothetical protein
MADVVDPIFPKRWVPPYLREQAQVEEVVRTKQVIAGYYNNDAFDGHGFTFYDRRDERWYSVKFHDGWIYLIEEGKFGDDG